MEVRIGGDRGVARMDDSREWATSWLADLVGPDAPGMLGSWLLSGPVVVHDRQCAGLAPAQLQEQLRELRRPIADGVPKNGHYAVVYERRWNDRDTVWLEAAEYAFGMFGARFVFVQPVRRTPHGMLVADGDPREPTEDDLAEPAPVARAVTIRAVADSVRAGARVGWATLRRTPTAVVVAVWVGVVLVGVVSAVSLTGLASSSRAAAKTGAAEHATGQGVPIRPATAAPVPAPRPGSNPGDLGLSVPISRPACDGGYGVIVANATRPGAYQHEISEFLARYSGASYLLAEQACSSLRAHTGSGNSIYAVYYGPYPALDSACATRGRIGGGSYVRKLDNSTPNTLVIKC